jgi:TonB family protein
MKVASACAVVLLAGAAASAAAADDDGSMPAAREYFFLSAYVQVCSGGSVVDTPSLKALRVQTVAYYHTLFAQAGEDATTKGIIGRIDANILPDRLVEWIKGLRPKTTVPDQDLLCSTNDAVIRRQVARHDIAMAEQGWPGAKSFADARVALRDLVADPAVKDSVTMLQMNPNPVGPARIHSDDKSCKPDFPGAAMRSGAEGQTTVQFNIDANGHPTAWNILRSAGPTLQHGLLDFAAVESLSKCRFDPARDAEERAVPANATIEYKFILH